MSDKKCMLPWMSLAVNTTGTTRPCCMFEGEVLRPDGTPYNLNTDSITEAYYSDYMKQLRQDFVSGKEIDGCRRCYATEAAGKESKRMMHFQKMKTLVPLVDYETVEPKHLLFLDLKLGNLCNLKCRICGPMISSSWAQEELMQIPYAERKTHQVKRWLVEGDWPQTTTVFWNEVKEFLPRLKYLDFTGGEPFMIKPHFELLQDSIDRGYSKYQILYYNTNGTKFPEQGEELWKNFERVEIALSIDNLGERFNLERSGADWTEVNANIKRFVELRKKLPNVELHCCPTVNIQNVYYLDELCTWIDQHEFDYINFNVVHEFRWMSIVSMTPAAQELVIDKLTNAYFSPKHRIEIDKIIQFIKNGNGANGKKFVKEMKELDKIRKEDFGKTHPEIAKAMGYDAT